MAYVKIFIKPGEEKNFDYNSFLERAACKHRSTDWDDKEGRRYFIVSKEGKIDRAIISEYPQIDDIEDVV